MVDITASSSGQTLADSGTANRSDTHKTGHLLQHVHDPGILDLAVGDVEHANAAEQGEMLEGLVLVEAVVGQLKRFQ